MSAPDLPPGARERLTRIFAAYPELREVVLYGSRATGASTSRSDIDLATRGITDGRRLNHLALDLEESDIPQKCDVRAYESIESATLRDHIKRDGVAIYRALVANGKTAYHSGKEEAGMATMTFLDAGEHVLREAGQPLHYKAITKQAIGQGHLESEGKDPAATLNALVGIDIRQREARSNPQRFVRLGNGFIGLAKALPAGLAAQIEKQNREIQQQLLDRIKTNTPINFEHLVAELLASLGFEEVHRKTSDGKDGGIDVRGKLVVGKVMSIRLAVQAKRWEKNVQVNVVRDFRGSLGMHEQGLIITTSDFSRGARNEAVREGASHPIALMAGKELASLLLEHGIGVERSQHTLFRLLDPESDAADS